MPSTETTRAFTVVGDVGAEFQIIALQSGTLKYYDFIDNSFEDGHNDLNNNLTVTLTSTVYENSIIFPSGGGDYVIKLIVLNGTNIKSSTSSVISRDISKLASTVTVTFQAETANTNNYATFPTTTSTGTVGSVSKTSISWDITNASTDAGGFGLLANSSSPFSGLNFALAENKIHGSIEKAWYFKTTETVDGAVTSSSKIVVDDLTDLVVGMLITGVSSGSLSGTPYITRIDTENKTIGISSAQTFADGITLTFKAFGGKYIGEAIGANIEFSSDLTITPTPLTKTVRAAVSSSTSVTLNNTLGLAGGNIVKYKGVGVNNSSSNLVTSVTADADGTGSDGVAVVQLAQTLKAGTELSFTGSNAVIKFATSAKINSYPNANRTINFDIDQFLSVGAAS